jgi:FK506-binding protein 4/5
MRTGEKGLVRCKAKYGFGPIGRLNAAPGAEVAVPADADLEYEIECLAISPAFHPKDATTPERIAEAELKKRHGNGFFHHQDYNRAIRCYQAGIKALDADAVDPEEEEAGVYAAMVKAFCDMSNNLSMALMKLERWKDAKEVCVKVIEVDKDNVKALYRGGLAALRQVRAIRCP